MRGICIYIFTTFRTILLHISLFRTVHSYILQFSFLFFLFRAISDLVQMSSSVGLRSSTWLHTPQVRYVSLFYITTYICESASNFESLLFYLLLSSCSALTVQSCPWLCDTAADVWRERRNDYGGCGALTLPVACREMN